jgi:purine nucleosidase
MYLLRPDLFTKRAARVEVELQGSLTRGMSVVDWHGRWQKENNCELLITVDFEAFVREFVAAIREL